MMKQVFNSIFEYSLRLLILLDEYDMPQTMDMLYAVDFMTLYSAAFGIGNKNLHGENDLKFSEFASHRELAREALKELVLNGTAQAVSYKDGMSYVIAPEGEEYSKSLQSDYATEYRHAAQAIIRATEDKTERELIADIYRLSDKSFRQGVKQ